MRIKQIALVKDSVPDAQVNSVPTIFICSSVGFRIGLVLMVSVRIWFRLQKLLFKFSLFGAFNFFFHRSVFYSSLFRFSNCAHHFNHLNLFPKTKSVFGHYQSLSLGCSYEATGVLF